VRRTSIRPRARPVDVGSGVSTSTSRVCRQARQSCLAFDVILNLQGDELHLSAGAFWLEWFPCTDLEVVARYQDAVTGLLSGRYRILESAIGNRVVKAQLQRPDSDRWQTIGTWCNLGVLLPWPRSTQILQNRSADRATNA